MLYTIDNLNAIGSHTITLPTDSIVYLGIKSDLMFPAYFSYLSADLDDNPQTERGLYGCHETPYWPIPHWYKDYVIGHFWTGNEPFAGTVSHELSGYVPVYGPVEREVARKSVTISGDNGEDSTSYLLDIFSFGNIHGSSIVGIMIRNEDEEPLGYSAYPCTGTVKVRVGSRIKNVALNTPYEHSKLVFNEQVLFPSRIYTYYDYGEKGTYSATSLGTVTIQDFPIAEYKPVTPKKIDIKLKVEEKSYAYIYHPAVSGGE